MGDKLSIRYRYPKHVKAIGVIALAIAIGYFLFEGYRTGFGSYLPGSIFGGKQYREHERKWWKEAVIYEIYPASFKDSNDDGMGDIQGIISKLNYLQDLGVNVISIGPHYASPRVDMGYDVCDYQDIYSLYGTLADVQALIEATHDRGMRIIFDLVINHSSNLHEWFKESRSSKDNPKRDWYFWRPAKYDADGNRHPPSNWRSHFSVPAWTWDEATQEYYLHIYAPEMPDFNWENDEFRQAIYDTAMIFWLKRGIDGFRIDTANKYSKNISFPDAPIRNPSEETQPAERYYNNGPRIHEFLGEMRDVFDRYDAMSVGELSSWEGSQAEVMKFVSAGKRQLDMVFNFDYNNLGHKRRNQSERERFQNADFKSEMSRWQTFVAGTDGWITNYLENHDTRRSISRFGSDASAEDRVRSGKMLAMIMATMTGTLFLYQGQEIGMVNAPRWWPPEEYKDVRTVSYYNKTRERLKDDPEALAAALAEYLRRARDHARLPMQWDSGPNAGFTSAGVTPWMRVHDDWRENNAEQQMEDPDSLHAFWKSILQLRKDYKDIFIYGRYKLLETDDDDLFVYTKEANGMKLVTVVNMSSKQKKWDGLAETLRANFKILLFNVINRDENTLSAWEGRVYLNSS